MVGVSKLRRTSRYSPVAVRNYQVGMWAWLLHRISGLVLVGYLFVHIWVISTVATANGKVDFTALMASMANPVVAVGELGLLGVVLFHGLNGIRVLLFDLGVGLNSQKQIFWGVIALAIVAFAISTVVLWPILTGATRV